MGILSEETHPIDEFPLNLEAPEGLRARFKDKPFTFSQLVDFALHDPVAGFYSGKNAGIKIFGVDDKPLIFPKIPNYDAYMELGRRLHQENPDAYKTPVEKQSPYYAIGVARYMETLFELGRIEPCIFEIGAGRGTLAKDILDYWEKYNPEFYARVKYHIVDISPKLVEEQKKRLGKHQGKVKWRTGNAMALPFPDKSIEGIVVDTELLDNLPTACIKRIKSSPDAQVSLQDFVEVGYQIRGDRVRELELSLSGETKAYLRERPSLLELEKTSAAPILNMEVGERGYVGAGVRKFYQELARVLKKGYVISSDYNYIPEEKGYMGMMVHKGGEALDLVPNIGKVDVYFSVDCWTANTIAKNLGLVTVDFGLGQNSFFRFVFSGEDAQHELSQLQFGENRYSLPIFRDFPNTFHLVHQIGLGEWPADFFLKLKEVCKKHHLQHEDLTFGRPGRLASWTKPKISVS